MLISKESPLILGSSSPRRLALLSELGIPLRVVTKEVDESPREREGYQDYLQRIVQAKMEAVVGRLAELREPGAVALAADTVVLIDGAILGKPDDKAHALELLKRLSGREHQVATRYGLLDLSSDAATLSCRTVHTEVTMAEVGEAVLERYARTGEGLDKAGAYAAQGLGSFLVQRISGSYTNVVGLPVAEVVQDLRRGGWLVDFP